MGKMIHTVIVIDKTLASVVFQGINTCFAREIQRW